MSKSEATSLRDELESFFEEGDSEIVDLRDFKPNEKEVPCLNPQLQASSVRSASM